MAAGIFSFSDEGLINPTKFKHLNVYFLFALSWSASVLARIASVIFILRIFEYLMKLIDLALKLVLNFVHVCCTVWTVSFKTSVRQSTIFADFF